MTNQVSNYVTRRISVAEMAPHIHSFKGGENKVRKIKEWLINWIKQALASEKIRPYDYLPSKGDLAFHIGVSLGTMQNVFRAVEDEGYVESKQRIGTYISPSGKGAGTDKLTSKREIAIEKIKNHILKSRYPEGARLFSVRKLSEITMLSAATIRNALTSLELEGIIKKKSNFYYVKKTDFEVCEIENKTLVEKIAQKLRNDIKSVYSEGEKLPSNIKLAKKYKVSVKTIYDAVKLLSKSGLVTTRRGKYGTVVARSDNHTEMYKYEKTELQIKNYIMQNCEVGSKLPSIRELSAMCNTSVKTVKKALDNIVDEGYAAFMRGRYGGTFVTDIPQTANEAYTWLALSSEYTAGDNN